MSRNACTPPGKIPGSFFKREGRPGEKATLTARMIDRPIRPLFPKDWRYETQLVAIPISVDQVNPYDILAMNGASAALMISEIPVPTPVGAVRIGKIGGDFVVNPPERARSRKPRTTELDLIVAGTEEAILMVEAGANEIPEAEILDALDIAHAAIKKLCALQWELGSRSARTRTVEALGVDQPAPRAIRNSHGARWTRRPRSRTSSSAGRHEGRQEKSSSSTPRRPEAPRGRYPPGVPLERPAGVRQAREDDHPRTDRGPQAAPGRSQPEPDPPHLDRGRRLPRAHGSALFTRGQTQALSVVALGTTQEEMRIDTLGLETEEVLLHHYNFPPFSVGEAGPARRPQAP